MNSLTPKQIYEKGYELACIIANQNLAFSDYTRWINIRADFLESIQSVNIADYQKICSIAENLANEMLEKNSPSD